MQSTTPQVLIGEVDSCNDKYFAQVQSSVTNLVDLKVALHEHDKVLDEQIDDFKSRIGAVEGNI
jgi:hypothetical protein